MTTLAHAAVIARTDVRRTIRKYAARPLQVAMFGLLLAVLVGGGGYLSLRLGPDLAALAGDIEGVDLTLIEGARGVVALAWLTGVVVYVVRAVGARGSVPGGEGTLAMVPTRDAVAGLLLAETGYLLVFLLPVGIVVGAALAAGTGHAAVALTTPLTVAVAAVAAVAVGFPVGLGVRHVATRIPFVARHKAWVVVGVFVVYFVIVTVGALEVVFATLFEPMRHAPPGWAADLLFLGVPGLRASGLRAAGSLLLVALLAPASVAATTAVAARHWFSDPALAGAEEPTAAPTRHGRRLEAGLAGALGRPRAALVVVAWRRAARAPLKLLYVAYPLLFLAGVFAEVLQTGVIPAPLPYGVLLFVTWAAAVVFTLNPLGDQGAVLPVVLLSGLSGRSFVAGQVLAGLLVGIPAGTALTAAVGLASPLALERVLLLTALTPVVMVLASVLAIGVGTAFPRFESIKITRSMSAMVPSLAGFALFTAYLFGTAVAAVLALDARIRPVAAAIATWLLPVEVTAGAVGGVAAVAAVGLALLPLVSYRYAVRQFDRYALE